MSAQNTIYAFREDRGGSKCGLAGRLSESKSRLVSLILNIFSFLKLVNSFYLSWVSPELPSVIKKKPVAAKKTVCSIM